MSFSFTIVKYNFLPLWTADGTARPTGGTIGAGRAWSMRSLVRHGKLTPASLAGRPSGPWNR